MYENDLNNMALRFNVEIQYVKRQNVEKVKKVKKSQKSQKKSKNVVKKSKNVEKCRKKSKCRKNTENVEFKVFGAVPMKMKVGGMPWDSFLQRCIPHDPRCRNVGASQDVKMTQDGRVRIQKSVVTYDMVSYYRKGVCPNLFAALPNHRRCHF
jgi:hypothetical protein